MIEIRVVEISPIENAISDVESKRFELENLEKRYLVLSQTEGAKINSNPLSAALNGAVDTGPNGGVPMYRKGMLLFLIADKNPDVDPAFFGPQYMSANPDKSHLIERLREAIDMQVSNCSHFLYFIFDDFKQVRVIDRCLRVHVSLCPAEMRPFHDTLEKC